MAQTHEGAMVATARRLGMDVQEWARRTAAGEKWCFACKDWHPRAAFGTDRSRYDGLASACRVARDTRRAATARHIPKEEQRPKGPARVARRDGDRKQARSRINHDVRLGLRPHPNALPCADCGHVWTEGERRHEYDHHLGYAAEHHYDVEPVCTTCHAKRDNRNARATSCKNGHEFTNENTLIRKNGGRTCLTCRRASDTKRGWKRGG